MDRVDVKGGQRSGNSVWKAVPTRKANENRNDRRAARHSLAVLPDRDERSADLIESSLVHDVYRVGGWTKAADRPLGVVVKDQKEARESRIGGKAARRIKQAAFQKILQARRAFKRDQDGGQ